MKKTILLGIAALGLLFTSCLGDNDTTVRGDNAYGVIGKTASGSKYMAFSVASFLTWDGIDKYEVGDALTISSYKFTSSNIGSGSVISAEYINVDKVYPVSEQIGVAPGVVDTTANVNANIGLTALGVNLSWADAGTFFQNRLYMTSVIEQTKSEIYDIKFVYDESKQVDARKEPLKDGYQVLDVVLTKRGDSVGTKETVTTPFVSNMTNLRDILKSANQKQISIALRYSQYDKTTQKCTLVYKPQQFFFAY